MNAQGDHLTTEYLRCTVCVPMLATYDCCKGVICLEKLISTTKASHRLSHGRKMVVLGMVCVCV